MNGLLNSKSKLSTGVILAIRIVIVNVNEGKKVVVLCKSVGYNGYDFDSNHGKDKEHKVVFMFKKFEDPCFTTGCIYLMSVNQPQTSNQVDEVDPSIEGIKNGPVDVLEGSPVSSEVVSGISQRIDDQVDSDDHDSEDTEYR